MRQQINLYRSELDNRLPFPNFKQGLQVLGIASCLLLLIVAWMAFRVSQADTEMQAVLAETEQLKLQIQQLEAELPAERMKPIEKQMVDLTNELKRLRDIKVLMSGQRVGGVEPGNQTGFSEQVAGLSRQHIDGISLTHFKLIAGGSQLELAGFSEPPEQAPRYLAGLNGDEAFSAVAFGQLDMQREEQTGQIGFTVQRKKEQEQPL